MQRIFHWWWLGLSVRTLRIELGYRYFTIYRNTIILYTEHKASLLLTCCEVSLLFTDALSTKPTPLFFFFWNNIITTTTTTTTTTTNNNNNNNNKNSKNSNCNHKLNINLFFQTNQQTNYTDSQLLIYLVQLSLLMMNSLVLFSLVLFQKKIRLNFVVVIC